MKQRILIGGAFIRAFSLIALSATLLFGSCSNGQSQNLSATEFAEKIKRTSSALVVDVRTQEEFEKGHLQNAENIDWNSRDFDNEISKLDKTKPVFVYCLSGGRSASAANKMRREGFSEVYELQGGIISWRAEGLPENMTTQSAGMSKTQFDALTNSDKLVLVDFYADWCAPCKKMKPYLEEIAATMSDKVSVVRINADDNPQLCKEMGIDALPVLQLYKSNKIVWVNKGFVSKEAVLERLK